jgi:hypothetical protein
MDEATRLQAELDQVRVEITKSRAQLRMAVEDAETVVSGLRAQRDEVQAALTKMTVYAAQVEHQRDEMGQEVERLRKLQAEASERTFGSEHVARLAAQREQLKQEIQRLQKQNENLLNHMAGLRVTDKTTEQVILERLFTVHRGPDTGCDGPGIRCSTCLLVAAYRELQQAAMDVRNDTTIPEAASIARMAVVLAKVRP